MKAVNNRGVTLMGVLMGMIIAGFAIFALSKFMLGVTEQTMSMKASANISSARAGLTKLLRDKSNWDTTVTNSTGGCFPGQAGCPVVLYDNSNQIYACNLGSGGVSFYSKAGQAEFFSRVDCDACSASADKNCLLKRRNLNPKDFVRADITVKRVNSTDSRSKPQFNFKLSDVITKKIHDGAEVMGVQTSDAYQPGTRDCGVSPELSPRYVSGVNSDGNPVCEGLEMPGVDCGNRQIRSLNTRNGNITCKNRVSPEPASAKSDVKRLRPPQPSNLFCNSTTFRWGSGCSQRESRRPVSFSVVTTRIPSRREELYEGYVKHICSHSRWVKQRDERCRKKRDCNGRRHSWGNCSANLPRRGHGSRVNLSYNSGGYKGNSNSWFCNDGNWVRDGGQSCVYDPQVRTSGSSLCLTTGGCVRFFNLSCHNLSRSTSVSRIGAGRFRVSLRSEVNRNGSAIVTFHNPTSASVSRNGRGTMCYNSGSYCSTLQVGGQEEPNCSSPIMYSFRGRTGTLEGWKEACVDKSHCHCCN